ncbi:hypothetical protein ACFL6L_00965 [candidate division KSB1 bacterium]
MITILIIDKSVPVSCPIEIGQDNHGYPAYFGGKKDAMKTACKTKRNGFPNGEKFSEEEDEFFMPFFEEKEEVKIFLVDSFDSYYGASEKALPAVVSGNEDPIRIMTIFDKQPDQR